MEKIRSKIAEAPWLDEGDVTFVVEAERASVSSSLAKNPQSLLCYAKTLTSEARNELVSLLEWNSCNFPDELRTLRLPSDAFM